MYYDYKVYFIDTDLSERLLCTVFAKSKEHAKVLAKKQTSVGFNKMTDIVQLKGTKYEK